MTYPIQIDEHDIRIFQDQGFLVMEDILSPAALSRYGAAVDAQVNERTVGDARSVEDKSTYEQSFIQCMRLWETCPTVRELSCDPGLAGIAAQLLGTPSVLLWQDQALYKEPGGRETTPHQDQTFWPIGKAPLVSAWIPFDDVPVDGGAMSYVSGSHRKGGLRVVDITHSTEPYNILDDPALAELALETVTAKAGSVTWHHGFTVHQATANTRNETRRVFTIVYIASGYQRIKAWPVFPLDRAGVAVGEIMQGEGLPVVWPPQADLPSPPEQTGQATGPQH